MIQAYGNITLLLSLVKNMRVCESPSYYYYNYNVYVKLIEQYTLLQHLLPRQSVYSMTLYDVEYTREIKKKTEWWAGVNAISLDSGFCTVVFMCILTAISPEHLVKLMHVS